MSHDFGKYIRTWFDGCEELKSVYADPSDPDIKTHILYQIPGDFNNFGVRDLTEGHCWVSPVCKDAFRAEKMIKFMGDLECKS